MSSEPQSARAQTSADDALRERMRALGERMGARESEHRDDLAAARRCAEQLHALVESGLEAFHAAAEKGGAGALRIELGAVRADDKHLRSIQFDVRRGRHTGIVTVKSRGEVTLVGPFRTGKAEGPCKSFPSDARGEVEGALGDFLESFVEEAATP